LRRLIWELPGGFIEQGESSEATAIRELIEEGGVVCAEKNLRSLGTIASAPSTIAAKVDLFAALACTSSSGGPVPELGHREFKWFSKAEVEALIEKEEILDSSTLIAYYRSRDII